MQTKEYMKWIYNTHKQMPVTETDNNGNNYYHKEVSMPSHWTLDTAKEKLDPAEYRMLETHFRIEGQKEVVEYVKEISNILIDVDNSFDGSPSWQKGVRELSSEIAHKYSHLFEKEPADAESITETTC